MRKAALHNLGCKVNAYETEAMRELLEAAGYEIVPFKEGADVYVINTCTVTNIADRKSRQMLHRARKLNPDAVVVAAGCYAQTKGEAGEIDPCIDIVLGVNKRSRIVPELEKYYRQREENKSDAALASGEEVSKADTAPAPDREAQGEDAIPASGGEAQGEGAIPAPGGEACETDAILASGTRTDNADVSPASGKNEDIVRKYIPARLEKISEVREYEELSISRSGEHTRAYIKVQDGCNQFCSYCAIPYARGRVRSRALDDVVCEVHRIAEAGCREVVLTGIHLSSYGTDFDGKRHLQELIGAVHGIDGIARIRLGSLEPQIITEEFAGALAALPKVCPHFHLSLQSGCDATLRRMNRRYTTAQYAEKSRILRKAFALPAVTTDIIAGFPGETEEEFAQTYAFVSQMQFYETHIFRYSRREGTRAAAMAGQIPEEVKAERSARLIALGKARQAQYERKFCGKTVEVLPEEKVPYAGEMLWSGHTREYIRVVFEGEGDLKNRLLSVRLFDEPEDAPGVLRGRIERPASNRKDS